MVTIVQIHTGDNVRIEAGIEEVIQYAYICDLCKKGYKHGSVCSICDRDICISCTKFDPRDMGDYPSMYCNDCFAIGEKYIDRINAEEEKHSTVIEKIEQEWKDEALKATNDEMKLRKSKELEELCKTNDFKNGI